jgi:oligopeptide transport system substrate-binding protein
MNATVRAASRSHACAAVRVGALAFSVSLGVAGCTDRGHPDYFGSVVPKHGPDEFWTNLGTEPASIDPGKSEDVAGGVLLQNLFAGLTQQHPKTLQPMPELATGWDIYDGGRRYVFHMRQSQWSDGVSVTAHDFEWSWKRLLDPKTAAKYSMFLYGVRHAELFGAQAVRVRMSDGSQPDRALVETTARAESAVERVVEAPELHSVFVVLKQTNAVAERAKLLRALNAKTAAGGAQLVADVADSSIVGVRALDDLTLEVVLEDPLPYFLQLLTFHTLLPVPRHVLEKLKAQGLNEDLWTRPEHIVSNGPYLVGAWKFRQYVQLDKNPRYWDAAHVRMPRVRLAMVESYNTALNMYEAGELDSIGESSLPAEFIDHLRKFKDYRRGPYLGTYFFWVNTKAAPVDDPRVRRALLLAIDRERLVKFVTRGGQIPYADLVPPGLAGYPGLKNPIFDAEAARALLREAGYGAARPLPRITLIYNTSEGHKQIATAVQEMWKHNLGIEVEIQNQEWKVYLKSVETKNFQLARMGWIGDYPDPYTFLEILKASNANNHSSYSDPEYDGLLARANSTQDASKRLELLEQAERRAMRAAPVIPIYVYTRQDMQKPYVRGSWLNYLNRFLFKYYWIDRRFYGGVPAQPSDDPEPPLIAADVRTHEAGEAEAAP